MTARPSEEPLISRFRHARDLSILYRPGFTPLHSLGIWPCTTRQCVFFMSSGPVLRGHSCRCVGGIWKGIDLLDLVPCDGSTTWRRRMEMRALMRTVMSSVEVFSALCFTGTDGFTPGLWYRYSRMYANYNYYIIRLFLRNSWNYFFLFMANRYQQVYTD